MTVVDPQVQVLIQSMTNWQRNQWARAGMPVALERVVHFANLERPA